VTPTEREVWINNLEADLNSCVDSNSVRYAMGEAYDRVRAPRDRKVETLEAENARLSLALNNLNAEVKGWLGIERAELVRLLSLTNVCVMETRVAEADAAEQRIRELEG